MLKNCLREPIGEIQEAALLLDAAVLAFTLGNRKIAAELIGLADMPIIADWTESLWGKGGPWTRPLATENPLPFVQRGQRIPNRMPDAMAKRDLLKRDGFHCRFCSMPLIRQETRSRIKSEFPDVVRWGSRNSEQHAAFQAMWLQFDHLVPHARGGTNNIDNIVVTCAPCNNGRSNLTLEEVGLFDPRTRQPMQSKWDGLERFKSASLSQ